MSRSFFIGVAVVGSLMAHQVDRAHAQLTHIQPSDLVDDSVAQGHFRECLRTKKDIHGNVDAFGCNQILKTETRNPTWSCSNNLSIQTCVQD